MIGVHCPGFEPARDEQAVSDAVARLGIEYPVLIDSEFEVWREYENQGWPARYLFDGRARLFDYHYGEGAYAETELAIQELLGVEREPLAPLRPEDAPGAQLLPQTAGPAGRLLGPLRGRRRVGGAGRVGHRRSARLPARRTGGRERADASSIPGAYPLIEHERHTAGDARARDRRGRASAWRPASRRAWLEARPTAGAAVQLGVGAIERAGARSRQSGRAVVLDEHARPGPVGALAGVSADEVRVIRPAAGVEQARAASAHATPARRLPPSGPARWVWPKITCASPRPSRAATSPIARKPARRSSLVEMSASKGPSPARLSAATASGKAPASARARRSKPACRCALLARERAPCAHRVDCPLSVDPVGAWRATASIQANTAQ